jgi:hypothetical protein
VYWCSTISQLIANEHPRQVDGEVDRFTFLTHREQGIHSQYNKAKDPFPELKAKEFYRTMGFNEITLIYGDNEQSYHGVSNPSSRGNDSDVLVSGCYK